MKQLSDIASAIFTVVMLGSVVMFGAYEMIPSDVRDIAFEWLSWGAGGIVGVVIVVTAVYLGIKTPTDGFAGSKFLKRYKTTITD